jgi:hypothetical protein
MDVLEVIRQPLVRIWTENPFVKKWAKESNGVDEMINMGMRKLNHIHTQIKDKEYCTLVWTHLH